MAVHEIHTILQLSEKQEEKMAELCKQLRAQGDWTPEKILDFTIAGLIPDLVDEMLGRFEHVIDAQTK